MFCPVNSNASNGPLMTKLEFAFIIQIHTLTIDSRRSSNMPSKQVFPQMDILFPWKQVVFLNLTGTLQSNL